MSGNPIACARPTGTLVGTSPPQISTETDTPVSFQTTKETHMNSIMIGRPAPDFTAPAYHKGAIAEVTLSSYLGRWVVLCFYPGDFTFV